MSVRELVHCYMKVREPVQGLGLQSGVASVWSILSEEPSCGSQCKAIESQCKAMWRTWSQYMKVRKPVQGSLSAKWSSISTYHTTFAPSALANRYFLANHI